MQKLLLIAVAGGLGALARYGLSGLVHHYLGKGFPWGTVVVNVLGCLVFGILFIALQDRYIVSVQTRAIVMVGFMGAFTTFSTYMHETGQMLDDGQWLAALGNVGAQNLIGIAALFLGMAIGRFV